MTDLGVNIGELTAAGGVIRATAGDFDAARSQVRSMEESRGSSGAATAVLARTLTAMAGAFDRAETQLRQTGDQLVTAAETYGRTEQMLSAWSVPGLANGGHR